MVLKFAELCQDEAAFPVAGLHIPMFFRMAKDVIGTNCRQWDKRWTGDIK